MAPFFLSDLLREFSDNHKQATIIVQEDKTDNLLKRYTQGELDVVILALPIPAKYLEVDTLLEEELS